jgi:hypothetical protein
MEQWRYSSITVGLDTRWKRVVSFTPLPPYPTENETPVPIRQEAGMYQRQSGRCGEEKILHCRESNPGRPARNPSLYRLSYSIYVSKRLTRQNSVNIHCLPRLIACHPIAVSCNSLRSHNCISIFNCIPI